MHGGRFVTVYAVLKIVYRHSTQGQYSRHCLNTN